ncbi:hypothetical protein CEXT_69741 [Caerostris extrusa]|uniref:Uncharacterized protein n=1 Tax=Caerostris extrusa TaxID=172846 RepID=A0AAV4XLB6_CAEEX|nr:hypothetical protein CEXT_69741 [Caerostris extrusa]
MTDVSTPLGMWDMTYVSIPLSIENITSSAMLSRMRYKWQTNLLQTHRKNCQHASNCPQEAGCSSPFLLREEYSLRELWSGRLVPECSSFGLYFLGCRRFL